MFVLGTAGHVDHGKSSLLRALTRMEPDRLPEEKLRGMTIDLNFVWLKDVLGNHVGIVDVPGHQRFVRNMISGTMSVDGFLFVCAADDGWMPQSEEHLAVLKSLGVSSGLGIVTKTDLVDEARVTSVMKDLETRLGEAFGKRIDVARFSAMEAENVGDIRAKLDTLIAGLPPPRHTGVARLWVDRVFTPKGMGVVVTGTLREGNLREGESVRLFPSGAEAVVKSLQSYHVPVSEARPVVRVAVQLAKVSAGDVSRGMLLVGGSGAIPLSRRAEVKLRYFFPVTARNLELGFHVGTRHEPARVVRLGDGGDAYLWARLSFANAIPLRAGDRFLLRTPGEERTLGAGIVVDPTPVGASHKKAVSRLTGWDELLGGFLAYQARKAYTLEPVPLAAQSSYTANEIEAAILESGSFRRIGPGSFTTAAVWEKAAAAFRRHVIDHAARAGEPMTEKALLSLVGRELGIPHRALRILLGAAVTAGDLKREGRGYTVVSSQKPLDPSETARRKAIVEKLEAGNGQPVGFRESILARGELKKSLWTMTKEGLLISLGDEHYMDRERYDALREKVIAVIRERGQATTVDLKVVLDNASRKGAVLMLEQMDRDRVTYFKDGVRRLLR